MSTSSVFVSITLAAAKMPVCLFWACRMTVRLQCCMTKGLMRLFSSHSYILLFLCSNLVKKFCFFFSFYCCRWTHIISKTYQRSDLLYAEPQTCNKNLKKPLRGTRKANQHPQLCCRSEYVSRTWDMSAEVEISPVCFGFSAGRMCSMKSPLQYGMQPLPSDLRVLCGQ